MPALLMSPSKWGHSGPGYAEATINTLLNPFAPLRSILMWGSLDLTYSLWQYRSYPWASSPLWRQSFAYFLWKVDVHGTICGVNEALSCCQSHIFCQILFSHTELLNLWGITKWGLKESKIQFKILMYDFSPALWVTIFHSPDVNYLLFKMSG